MSQTAHKLTDGLLRRSFELPPIASGGKEARGRVAVAGGSASVPGAPMLAGLAAMRCGAGRLQLAVPREAVAGTGVAMPEAMVVPLEDARELCGDIDALVVGPGMFPNDETRTIAIPLLAAGVPTIVDAGALCALQAGAKSAATRDPRAIITPHAGEMAFLMDLERDEIERNPRAYARQAARRYGVVAVLKGETTYVAAEGHDDYVHPGGATGLATSGSGDALSGVAAALLARGAPPLTAALWAVRLHAKAGKALQRRRGIGFLARELCDELQAVMKDVPSPKSAHSREA